MPGLRVNYTSTIPSGGTATIEVREDVGATGTVDNRGFYELSNGSETVYLGGFDASAGNDVWAFITENTTDINKTPIITSVEVSNDTGNIIFFEWDSAVSENGVVHERVNNTDHQLGRSLKKGYPKSSSELPSGLIIYTPLHEDTTGGTAYDFSGNNNDGNVNGASGGVTGLLNDTAYSFGGSSDYITYGSGLLGTGDSFSVSVWVKFNSLTNDQRVFSTRSDVDTLLSQGRSTTDSVEVFSEGTDYQIGTVTTGTWYHLCYTYEESSNTLTGYIDGTEGTQASVNPTTHNGAAIAAGANADTNANFLDGVLAELQLYNRELSASEVQNLYDVVATDGSITTTWQ